MCVREAVYWSDLLCCQTVGYELLDMASHLSVLVHSLANLQAPALPLGPVLAVRTPQGPQSTYWFSPRHLNKKTLQWCARYKSTQNTKKLSQINYKD